MAAGPASQRGTPAFWKPTALPSNREAKASLTGKRDFTRLMKGGAARRLRTPFSFYLACGRRILGFSPKEGGGGPDGVSSDKKPWPRRNAARPRGRRTHRTKHSADRVGRRERRGKSHPSSSPLPGARDRWSRAPLYREKKDGFSRGLSELQRQGNRN